MTDAQAKIIYDAMSWAYSDGSGNKAPEWQDGGNAIAQDKARDAARRIANLSPIVKPLEWQPIETAPKDGTRFWAYEKDAGPARYECWWQNDFGLWEGWQTDWDNEPEPTHWMPLPDGPSDQPTQSDNDAEIERLREALSEYMDHDEDYTTLNNLGDHTASHRWKRARAALEERG